MVRLGAIIGLMCLAALSSAMVVDAEGEQATGALRNGAGAQIGDVRLEQTAAGVQIIVSGRGLTPGEHGVHVHTVGVCEGSAFASASGHFNPAAKKHGLQSPDGPHGGDLPNLAVDGDGKTYYTAVTTRISLAAGAAAIFDDDGAALVVHAGSDDQLTDPAGNSGERVACAVLTRTATAGMPRTGAGGLADPWTPFQVAATLVAVGGLTLALRRHRV